MLEARSGAGGRCRTLRAGDAQIELGRDPQTCAFDEGLYFNSGAWRFPYHHHGVLDYCRRLGVVLEPFVQVNHNAYVHVSSALGGRPQRYRHVLTDFHGHIAELLAKAAGRDGLHRPVSREDREILLEALRLWGALDKDYAIAQARLRQRGAAMRASRAEG